MAMGSLQVERSEVITQEVLGAAYTDDWQLEMVFREQEAQRHIGQNDTIYWLIYFVYVLLEKRLEQDWTEVLAKI